MLFRCRLDGFALSRCGPLHLILVYLVSKVWPSWVNIRASKCWFQVKTVKNTSRENKCIGYIFAPTRLRYLISERKRACEYVVYNILDLLFFLYWTLCGSFITASRLLFLDGWQLSCVKVKVSSKQSWLVWEMQWKRWMGEAADLHLVGCWGQMAAERVVGGIVVQATAGRGCGHGNPQTSSHYAEWKVGR